MSPKRKKAIKPAPSKKRETKSHKKVKYPRSSMKVKLEISGKTYYCRICEKAFKSKSYMVRHQKLCSKDTVNNIDLNKPVYSCTECNKKFRFKKSFLLHQKHEHSKLPDSVKCPQCSVCCPDNSILKAHIAKVHERAIFECPHCKKQFVRNAHVLRHLAQKGCGGLGVSFYPCEICNAEFSRKDNLMVHLRLQHITQKEFSCKLCSYATRSFSKHIIHWVNKHTERPQFECDHCGKVTSSRAAMVKHLEIHGEKKFACDVCGYSTFTIEVMRRHVLTHVRDKPYKCNACELSFIQRAQLHRHLQRHNNGAMMCKICQAKLASKAELIVHMRQHKGLKKLTCPYKSCEQLKEFPTKESLQAHVNNHLEERPYSCEVCQKRFQNEINMRRHVQSHALERPRRCMYCVAARAYVRGMQLVLHVRKAHPAAFRDHLAHVRQVMGTNMAVERVKKSELESILNVLDAEADRIIEGYGEGVLYGGMQENDVEESEQILPMKDENSPLMSEEELVENLGKLLWQLIDGDTLKCFGWPNESVDTVLEKVIEQCGARAAERDKWTRVQCLRENAKRLFLYVIEDKNIARMLDTHTIDQIVKHILAQVSDTHVRTLEVT